MDTSEHNDASLDLPFKEALQGYDCSRGELRLTEEEFCFVEKLFSKRGQFRFQYVPEAPPQKKKKNANRNQQKNRQGTTSSSQPISTPTSPLKPPPYRAPTTEELYQQYITYFANKPGLKRLDESLYVGPVIYEDSDLEKIPPDWSDQLLIVISKFETFCSSSPLTYFYNLPFMGVSDFEVNRIRRSAHPLQLQSLSDIVKKLSNKFYSRLDGALNDIFSIFVCLYTYARPATPLWLNAQLASLELLRALNKFVSSFKYRIRTKDETEQDKIVSEKLNETVETKDEFQVDSEKYESDFSHTESIGNSPNEDLSEIKNKDPCNENNEQFDETLENTGVSDSENQSVSDEERFLFQELLGCLSSEQHYNLFNQFQETAIWKCLEDGMVELNDRSTSPDVFREMIRWCQEQIAEQH